MVLILFLSPRSSAHAAQLAAGGNTGTPGQPNVQVPIVLTSGTGETVSAIHFELLYDTSSLTLPNEPVLSSRVTPGEKTRQAGKTLAVSKPYEGKIIVVIYFGTQDAIPDGEVAVVGFDIKSSAVSGPAAINFGASSAANPQALAVPLSTTDGTISIGVTPAPSASPTRTATASPTRTPPPTLTRTSTPTPSNTAAPPTVTSSPTRTGTPTTTAAPTNTRTPTATATRTPTPSITATGTASRTPTAAPMPSNTRTPTATPIKTSTATTRPTAPSTPAPTPPPTQQPTPTGDTISNATPTAGAPTPALVLRISFDKHPKTREDDLSEYRNNGRCGRPGGCPRYAAGPSSAFGQAGLFNGKTTALWVPASESLDFAKGIPFSITAWVYGLAPNRGGPIAAKCGAPYRGFQLGLDEAFGKRLEFQIRDSKGNLLLVRGRTAVTTRSWRHVAATYDGSGLPGGIRLYVDGRAEALSKRTGRLSSGIRTSCNLGIGASKAPAFISGRLDDVRIYRGALSPADISALAAR